METDNVLQYLDEAELVTYQEMFSLFDKQDTGNMPIEEIPLFIRGLGHCPTEAELKEIMQQLEQTEEGSVSFSSIVSLLAKRKKEANIEDELTEALQGIQIEVDGSASAGSPYMSIYGIKKIMGTLGEVMSEQEVKEFNDFIEQNNLKEDNNFKFRDLCKILAYGYME